MIKKFLLGLFVGFIGFVSFSNGYDLSKGLYVRQVGPYAYSPFDNNFDISVIKYGTPLTQQFGLSKPVLYLHNGTYFLWKNSDVLGGVYPYMSSFHTGTNIYIQGFPLKYAICDLFSGYYIGNYNLTGCTVYDMTSDSYSVIQNFMSSITTNDFYAFNYARSSYTYESYLNSVGLLVCFSSSQYGKSICFGIGNCKYGSDTIYPGYVLSNCSSQNKSAYSGYGVSLPLSFNALDRSNFDVSPGQGGNINGGSSTSQNVDMTGNLVYNTCTNGYIINRLNYIYGSSYKHVCYAGTYDTGLVTSDFTLSNILPGNGLNIIDLYHLTSNGQSWNDWFNSNSYAIQKFREGRLNANPFLSSPIALYSYFDIMYDETYTDGLCMGDNPSCPYTILNYCKLLLYSDYNSPYEYEYFKYVCDDLNNSNGDVVLSTGDVGSVDGSGELLPPGTNIGGNNGSVTSSGTVTSVDWSGILSGDTSKNFDGKTFINDVYQKFQSKLIKPYYGSTIGIIPNWILVFLFALILFRFLQH